MPQPISFLIQLFDKISGPAHTASGSLEELCARLDKLEKSTKRGESGITKLDHATNLLTKGFHLARTGAEAALHVLEKIDENVATEGLFDRYMGAGEGTRFLDWLGAVQRKTGLTRDELEGLTQPLAKVAKSAGLGFDAMRAITVAALDAGHGRIEETTAAMSALVGVASSGKIKMGAFRALGLSGAGFKSSNPEGDVAISMGTLLDKLAKLSPDGKLGGGAVQSSETLGAKLKHVRGIPDEIYDRLAKNPALVNKLADALDKLTTSLTSEKVIGSLATAFDKLSELLVKTDWDGAAKAIEKVAQKIEELAGNPGKTWNTVVGAVEGAAAGGAAGLLAGGVGAIPGAVIGGVLGGVAGSSGVAFTEGQKNGRSYSEGLADGISSMYYRIVNAARGAGGAAIDGTAEKLGIHSPSRVMERLGAQTAEGFALGMQRGRRGEIEVVEPAAVTARGGRFGGGGPVHVEVSVVVNVPDGKNAQEIAALASVSAREAVLEAFAELATERGGN